MVVVIDGRNALFRFGHVHLNLRSVDGQPTGVLYGITGLLARMKKHYPQRRFVVCWDGEDSRNLCWRKRIYPAYKENRRLDSAYGPGSWKEAEKTRKSILGQIPEVKQLFHLLGIPQLEVAGVEADDTVATLAFALQKQGFPVSIYSSDKDFCQLLHRGIQLIRDVDKSAAFAPETAGKVFQYWRCTPQEALKLRSFVGDTSDGIPSIKPKVGVVTASKLLRAGADPAVARFADLPRRVQIALPELRDYWKALHRNYCIMQLVETATDARYTAPQQAEMYGQIQACLSRLDAPRRAPHREVTRFLAARELVQALANRHILCHLQTHGSQAQENTGPVTGGASKRATT